MWHSYVTVKYEKLIIRPFPQGQMMHSYRVRAHQYAPVPAYWTRLTDGSDQSGTVNRTEPVRVPAQQGNGNA
jgi:hypothetical protein